ncbi:hypothetical protein HOLleu_22563 [Holothuria leucospilota]|uniref:Uncharacterized protein n=1 Tax=Holothuria leucospilota TaxID=206669 RepID=A0A9Q1BZ82_HOLLE|nr:hypothetical protein HOLleu_22563 [Holothuria leucospilota]
MLYKPHTEDPPPPPGISMKSYNIEQTQHVVNSKSSTSTACDSSNCLKTYHYRNFPGYNLKGRQIPVLI